MDLKKKLQEANDFLNQLQQRKTSLQEQLTQTQAVEQQIIGRIQTYSELLEEQDTSVVSENSSL